MSRRRRPEKRVILPDPKFGDLVLSKFMNNLMLDGKKSVAERIVYGALETVEVKATEPETPVEKAAVGSVNLAFGAEIPEMKAGEKIKIPVLVKGNGKFQSAVIGLNFDSSKVAVRSVAFGDAFGISSVNGAVTPFLNQKGKMYVSLLTKDGLEIGAAGTLAIIEIEALTAGKPVIAFDRNVLSFLAGDGRNLAVKFE